MLAEFQDVKQRRNWFALQHTEPMAGAEPQAIETATPDWNAARARQQSVIDRLAERIERRLEIEG